MKIPKDQKRFCNYCKKHTSHTVKRESTGRKRRELARGQRRFRRKKRGFGSFPKENPKDRAKPTKKLDLRYKCKDCGKIHTVGKGYRSKKFEIIKK